MKLQFLVTCVFAIAKAGYLNPNYQANSIVPTHGSSIAPSSSYVTYYQGGQNHDTSPVYQPQLKSEHVPVIKNGVPVDTPEVQQARAEHFALYAKAAAAAEAAKAATAQKQLGGHYDDGRYYQQEQAYYPAPSNQHTPELGSYIYQSAGHLSNSGAYAHQAEPVDPVAAEVQQAKATHFIVTELHTDRTVHFQETVHRIPVLQGATTGEHHRYRRGVLGYPLLHDAQHVPLITKEGVPVETPEVQLAKAQHFLAHAQARASHQDWSQGSTADYTSSPGIWTNYGTPEINKVQYSVNHNYGGWQPYTGPQHYPQIDKNGNPVETPEVQLAKHQHFLAHSQAKLGLYSNIHSGSYYGSSYPHANITPDGVPEETPEVKIAKARHFAAHAEEQARHAKWAGQTGSGYGNGFSYETGSHY